MYLYPAIDLVQGKAVRLFKGDYAQMTVYSDDPVGVAKDFQSAGSKHIHLVDLEGAKSGVPENLETIRKIVSETDLFVEVGGGIRNMETVETYFADTACADISWTLDYNGVTFYFADGELAEAGNGRQTATVSFPTAATMRVRLSTICTSTSWAAKSWLWKWLDFSKKVAIM